MGQGVLGALSRLNGSPEVVVANRGRARAAQLAAEAGARAVDLARLPTELAEADVVVTGTAAGEILLGPDEVAAALRHRPERPLLVVDVAVPRDVDPAAGRLPGVTLLDLDDLTRYAESGMAARRAEVGRVRQIVEEELERYRATRWAGRSPPSSRRFAPVARSCASPSSSAPPPTCRDWGPTLARPSSR